MNGPGFYKDADGLELHYAPNSVDGPGVILRASNRVGDVYPIDGWTWYDDESAASTALTVPIPIVRIIVRKLRVAFPNLPRNIAIVIANRIIQLLPNFQPEE